MRRRPGSGRTSSPMTDSVSPLSCICKLLASERRLFVRSKPPDGRRKLFCELRMAGGSSCTATAGPPAGARVDVRTVELLAPAPILAVASNLLKDRIRHLAVVDLAILNSTYKLTDQPTVPKAAKSCQKCPSLRSVHEGTTKHLAATFNQSATYRHNLPKLKTCTIVKCCKKHPVDHPARWKAHLPDSLGPACSMREAALDSSSLVLVLVVVVVGQAVATRELLQANDVAFLRASPAWHFSNASHGSLAATWQKVRLQNPINSMSARPTPRGIAC